MMFFLPGKGGGGGWEQNNELSVSINFQCLVGVCELRLLWLMFGLGGM